MERLRARYNYIKWKEKTNKSIRIKNLIRLMIIIKQSFRKLTYENFTKIKVGLIEIINVKY